MKISITNLDAVRERLNATPNRLDLIRIEISRECAEWLLADLAKRGKRLQQSVEDPKTREAKREKREAELTRLAYAVDAINNALNQ